MRYILKYKNPYNKRNNDVAHFSYEQAKEALDYRIEPAKEDNFITRLAKTGLLDAECLKS